MVQLICKRVVLSIICLRFCNVLIIFNVLLNHNYGLGISKNNKANDLFYKSSESFADLVAKGLFVDKSALISDLLNRDEKVFQITRPRKWGKTVNLQMLKRFFEIELDKLGNALPVSERVNHLLFSGNKSNAQIGSKSLKVLADENSMKYFGKHPVIYLNLKNVGGNSKEEFDRNLKHEIVKLYLGYSFIEKYLHNSSELLDEEEKLRLNNFVCNTLRGEYILDALEFLSMILYEHFHSYVCLFIDDYDYPLVNIYLKYGDRSELFQYAKEVFWHFYEYAFKENQYLLKAVITGTLNFDIVPSGEREFFTYKYISYNTFLDESFSKYYGFSQEEIVELLLVTNKSVDLSKLKEWYGGFLLHGREMFNPMSVIKYILNDQFDYYLYKSGKTALTSFLDRGWTYDSMQDDFHLLSEGKQVIRYSFEKAVNFKHLEGDFYSLFCHTGYWYPILPQRVTSHPIWRFRVPNFEVRGIIASGLGQWVRNELNISVFEYNRFTKLLLDHKVEEFAITFQDILTKLGTYNELTTEGKYHFLMSGLCASLGLGYLVESIKMFDLNMGENVIVPLEKYGKCITNIEYNNCKPWQDIESIVNNSLRTLSHRPRGCTVKVRSHPHVTHVLYVALGFKGPKVFVRSRMDPIS